MFFDLNKFWQQKNLLNYLLLPIAAIYSWLFTLIFKLSSPKKVKAKIICIGNVTVGGAGKTPLALAIGEALKLCNYKIAFISRGYKGTLSHKDTVVKVDPKVYDASQVGDEPLLLAKMAPTYICINRYLAAKQATLDGAQVIIMDDGLQNYSLHKDIKILVLDDLFYFGNSMLLPAGPLRSSKKQAISNVDFICVNQNKQKQDKLWFKKPTFFIKNQVVNATKIKNKEFILLSGIANPEKLYLTLDALNAKLVQKFIFPDHHAFTESELDEVVKASKAGKCKIITTSKDLVRIPKNLHKHFIVLEIKKELPQPFLNMLLERL